MAKLYQRAVQTATVLYRPRKFFLPAKIFSAAKILLLRLSQNIFQIVARRDVKRALIREDDEARLCARRFLDEAARNVIDGNFRGALRLGKMRGNLGGQLQSFVADVRAADDDVRARDVLRVEPKVVGRGDFESQSVVLRIIFPDENFRAVGRKKFQRLRLFAERGFFYESP